MKHAVLKKCVNTFLAVLILTVAGYFTAQLIGTRASSVSLTATMPYTVVLDAGHGGADGGCVSPNGTVEAGLNLSVCKLIQAGLQARGVEVVMTRETEESLSKEKMADMRERRRIMNDSHADIVVSVHMNMFSDRSVHGSMAFYMKGSEEGQRLSQLIIDAVCDATGQGRRMANPGDYYVIRESPLPSALVECGFLSNTEDEIKLKDESYQAMLASGIVEGIIAYLTEKTPAGTQPSP